MSTDYSYDDQGQFFPYFFVTVSALVIVPVTYSALKPRKELENTAPKIQSGFKPEHADLVDGQRRKQRKRERKVKRIILAAVGWAFIALNVYWMATVQRTAPKIWDPYEILGIDRVSRNNSVCFLACSHSTGCHREASSIAIPQAVGHNASRQSQAR